MKFENKKLPESINYNEINGLRLEARQKLEINPISIGQARLADFSGGYKCTSDLFREGKKKQMSKPRRKEYEG